MITEHQKFLAETFRIAGFAIMTPFGKFIIDLQNITLYDLTMKALGYISFSLVLFIFGIILLNKAYKLIKDK